MKERNVFRKDGRALVSKVVAPADIKKAVDLIGGFKKAISSGDRIAIDVKALNILQGYKAENRLGMPVWEFPQIKRAVELGLGVRSGDEISVVLE